MAELLTLVELKDHMGIRSKAFDSQLTALRDEVKALFESAAGRTDTPFVDAASRVEVRDGTGSSVLYLDYPVATMTSVLLGFDTSDPVETLTVADTELFRFVVGDRRIVRVDGGVFGRFGAATYVQVTYGHQADLPTVAKPAIKRVCAQLWEQRGSEDASRESLGDGSSRVFTHLIDEDPVWKAAVMSVSLVPVT